MFRYLSALCLAILLIDIAVSALETRRVWVMGEIVLKRRIHPIGYWLMTSLWLLSAFGSTIGITYLTCIAIAITSSGPYKTHAFFSTHQAWPYAATTLLFGFIAFKIIRRRLLFLRRSRGAN